MPAEYIPWFRMKVDDLPPREYWQTAQEDMQIAGALQEARYRGEARANEEERKAQKAKADKAKQEQAENASLNRLRAQRGG